MIAVVLAFAPDSAARLALRPAHRQELAALHAAGTLVAAGPYADETGALLLFDANRADVDAAMAADPYYRAPGVTVVAITEWSPVVGGVG
jgi:uncharacterized protein YciI